MATGREQIILIGKKLYDNFSLDDERRLSVYQQVYLNLRDGLNPEKSGKGLLLIGDLGVGKTALMRIMQKIFMDTPRGFKWLDCNEIPDLMDVFTVAELKSYYGKNLKMDLYIDDLGIGNSLVNKWGNSINLVSEILIERYNLFVAEGYRTHLSSNKHTALDKDKYPNAVTLETLYGDRIVDRLREMCETIIWKGTSLRKQNHAATS